LVRSNTCRFLNEVRRWHVEKHLLQLLVRPDYPLACIPIADMVCPVGLVHSGAICYSAGVGEDIRFERYLTDVLGANVWAFDPTPRSIDFMSTSAHDTSRLRFVPIGLWGEDTTLRFYAPSNPSHVSHSVLGDLGGAGSFEARCVSVATAMKSNQHDRIDLLKMNIEGAEDVVLQSMLEAGITPDVLILTWEGNNALRKALTWTERLRSVGYGFVGRKDWFFTYVRKVKTPRTNQVHG
jgi:FkbM family methyltransferase